MIMHLKALVHQTHGRFVGVGFLGWVSPGKGTIVGANFLGHSSLGSVGFLGNSSPGSVGVFGNLSLGRSKKKQWFSCMFVTKKQ
jgi:hypothetical protein